MNSSEFINKLVSIKNSNTTYMLGVWGQEVTNELIARKSAQYPTWYNSERVEKFKSLVGKNYRGFDCICLIKSVLWGYPSMVYAANGVPDFGADSIEKYCTDISSDFTNIETGEVLHMKGHVGVYIGNGEVVECTVAWTSNVLISKLSQRNWLTHGKLKWIDYSSTNTDTTSKVVNPYPVPTRSIYYIAGNTMKGKDVAWVQWNLKRKGYKGKDGILIVVDESFGPNCDYAIRQFSKDNGITSLPGNVGPLCRAALAK